MDGINSNVLCAPQQIGTQGQTMGDQALTTSATITKGAYPGATLPEVNTGPLVDKQQVRDDNDKMSDMPTSPTAPSDGGDGGDGDGDGDGDFPISMQLPGKRRKRKSRPGKTIRAITGFEEFYTDRPTTPAEFAEESNLYAPDKPFAERIEEAIQRFRQKRRFDSQRQLLFDKYLALGGIDSSQRTFQGLDPSETQSMTNDEIRQMTACNFVCHGGSKFYDPDEPGGWTVDFAAVVKGFLSRWVIKNYPRSDQGYQHDNEQAASLIQNFLGYLQMHNVCPEYTYQILAAKAICSVAPTELRFARELYHELVDSFNAASKFLFCDGGIFEIVNGAGEERSDPKGRDAFMKLIVFRLTVMDTSRNMNHPGVDNDPRTIHIEYTKTQMYQVISVHRRKKKDKALVEKVLVEQGLEGVVKPAGTMLLRRSMIEHAYSNLPRPDEVDFSQEPLEQFIVDDDVLAKVQPGMRMQLEVCKLNVGVNFIKSTLDVRVSFDTFLPQSLMLTWKDPVPNDRPAPSVENGVGEQGAAIETGEIDF